MSRYLSSLFIVFIVCSGSASGETACSEGSNSIQIAEGGLIRTPGAQVSDPVFGHFVDTVTFGVKQLLQENNRCEEGDKFHSDLVFIKASLSTTVPNIPFRNPLRENRSTCKVQSPWADIEVDSSRGIDVRGVIRWDERQFIVDHALMAGAIGIEDSSVSSISSYAFERYAYAYAEREILIAPPRISLSSPIPPDILWLFRNSWQSTRGPFPLSAWGSMNRLIERSAEGYADLVIGLIDRCFKSDNHNQRYENILELEGTVPLERYQVDTLL